MVNLIAQSECVLTAVNFLLSRFMISKHLCVGMFQQTKFFNLSNISPHRKVLHRIFFPFLVITSYKSIGKSMLEGSSIQIRLDNCCSDYVLYYLVCHRFCLLSVRRKKTSYGLLRILQQQLRQGKNCFFSFQMAYPFYDATTAFYCHEFLFVLSWKKYVF